MTVDQRAISEMARLMGVLNGTDRSPRPHQHASSPIMEQIKPESRHSDPATQAMSDVLRRLHAVTETAIRTGSGERSFDPELREALVTEKTDHGARIGQWEIREKIEAARRMYDIVRVGEDLAIAGNLSLYESALGLVRVLNRGGYINSPDAVIMLQAEQEYSSALEDAIHFTRLINEKRNSPRRAVFEVRCGEAKNKAANARRRIMHLAEQRR